MVRRILLALAAFGAAGAAEELFNAKVARIEPFPREVARGKKVVVRGVILGNFETPELILIAPNGKTYLNEDNQVTGRDFTFTVRFEEGAGPYRLEVIVRKYETIKSAMRVTVWHGAKRPPEDREPPPPEGPPTPRDHHPRLVERHFLARLNRFRAQLDLPPVGWNEAVAARAREHAQRMAEAEKRLHRFGSIGGVDDMLKRDGAGPGLSGPAEPWPRVTSLRPFARHAPQPPGPRATNHVVPFVLADDSLERMFEQYFVREAAFRICAADPNLVEVAVGCARTPPPPPRPGHSVAPPVQALVYYCVCFVQLNDITVIRDQDAAYREVLERAEAREPDVLRALGAWGRGEAVPLLREAWKDERPEVAAAAFDALLLLDEEKARKELHGLAARSLAIQREGRYAEALAMLRPYALVTYDAALPRSTANRRREAEASARDELRKIRKLPEPVRAEGLAELRARCEGLDVIEAIDRTEDSR
jgi:hypothetical protein